MTLQEWFKRHRRKVTLTAGGLCVCIGAAMLFWSNGSGAAVSEEERIAAANVARMEARMQSQISGQKGQQSPDKPIFSGSYRERQEAHLRYMVIALMLFGAGFLAYGFLKRDETA